MFPSRMLILIAVMFVFACASGNRTNTRGGKGFSSNVLTAGEIAQSLAARPSSSAYDVIRTLRPQFLTSRGCQSARNGESPAPVVFVNGVKMSGRDALHRLNASDLHEIRYVRPIDAMTLYGQNHPRGVLVVATK